MSPDDLEVLLRTRRSVRRFRDEVPSRELLERVLGAAITAPSASNKQPWRFLVVTDRAKIAAMAGAVREATARIASHIPEESMGSFRAYGDYFTRFETAPVVIVPIWRGLTVLSHLVSANATIEPDDRARIVDMEQSSGLVGTSLALENLLLMAHALGLGASGMTGPLVASDRLRELLEVPASWGIVALVPMGFPAEEPQATDRKDLAKVVRWIA
jgi:nitroreductase